MRTVSDKNGSCCECDESSVPESPVCLCPIRGIIDVVSKKWSVCIVSLLTADKTLRFNEIKSALGNISPKTLADRLKDLEENKLVKREIYAEIPPRVEYSLTKSGNELKKALMPLVNWVRAMDNNSK
jgi:DNA-binding HxlR family transcriptional regulator